MNQKGIFIAVLILLLPLLFIQINEVHDWGDDFAGFISQAQSIIEGKPFYQTGFVANLEKPDLVAAPIGWSLLLVPVIYFAGINMSVFKIYISIFLVLWGLGLFLIFRAKRKASFALLLVIFIFYHPAFISFKSEIISDAAFGTTFTFSLYYISKFNKLNRWQCWLIGLLIGLCCLIRPIGFVLFGSIVFVYFRDKQWRRDWVKFLGLLLGAIFLYTTTTKLLFPCENSFSHYQTFLGKELGTNVSQNLSFYFLQWQQYFSMLTEIFFLKSFFAYVFSILLGIGLIRYLFRWNVYTVTVATYLIIIFIWPFRSQGFRYMYPVLPFLLYISLESFWIFFKKQQSQFTWLTNAFLLLLLFLSLRFNHTPFQDYLKTKGCQTTATKALYSYLSHTIKNKERVVFTKPRVLCLYAKISAIYPMANMSFENMKTEYTLYDAQYFVTTKNNSLECFNPQYAFYLDSFERKKILIWENEDFAVFKRNNK